MFRSLPKRGTLNYNKCCLCQEAGTDSSHHMSRHISHACADSGSTHTRVANDVRKLRWLRNKQRIFGGFKPKLKPLAHRGCPECCSDVIHHHHQQRRVFGSERYNLSRRRRCLSATANNKRQAFSGEMNLRIKCSPRFK